MKSQIPNPKTTGWIKADYNFGLVKNSYDAHKLTVKNLM